MKEVLLDAILFIQIFLLSILKERFNTACQIYIII